MGVNCPFKVEKKDKQIHQNEGIRERESKKDLENRERENMSRFPVWSIDGSILTETELDGEVSLSGFSVCCADKTLIVGTFPFHTYNALTVNIQSVVILSRFPKMIGNTLPLSVACTSLYRELSKLLIILTNFCHLYMMYCFICS